MTKIAIPALEDELLAEVSDRFGRAPYILIVEADGKNIELVQVISNAENAAGAQGAGTSTAEAIANSGATVVIAPNVGPNAWKALQAAKIESYKAPSGVSVKEAVQKYLSGELERITGATREGEHHH